MRMIQSPLNYTGGKYKLLPQLLPYFPPEINCFVDLFCGGCNVGINISANRYIYNDNCKPLINLYSVMQRLEAKVIIDKIESLIKKYDLSDIKTRGYDFYNCSSSNGLAEYNRDKYLKLRADFNCAENHDEDYYIMLYVLIVYAFNNQIRFNRKGEFNLPPGKRDFNQKMQKKLKTFIGLIHEQNVEFTSLDFRELDVDRLNKNDFVYADPPYLITCASYNEQDGWKTNDEIDLLQVLDELTSQGIRFALSNVLEAKGLENKILKNWIESRPAYKMIDLNYSYTNSNYQRQNKEQKTREVLVVNY
jgi:DNA adenine methylase